MTGHRVVLRPRSLLESCDLTSIFIRVHQGYFARLLPWVIVPALGAYLLHVLGDWRPARALLLEVAVTNFTADIYALLCGDLMLQPTTSLTAIQIRFLKSLPRYVFTRALLTATLFVSFGLTFSRAMFAPEAALLERGGVRAAWSRSGALMSATPGRWIAFGVIAGLLLLFGAAAMETLRYAVREMFGLSQSPLSAMKDHMSWAPFLGIALAQPFLVAARFLLYIDCRTRREGWDLQVQFNALAISSNSHLRSGPPAEAA